MNPCISTFKRGYLWLLAFLLFSVKAQAALPPDPGSLVCPDSNDATLQSEFHVGWFHNVPLGTFSADGHWLTPYNGDGSLTYGNFGSKVSAAQPLVFGSGISASIFYTSAYKIKGANEVSAASAYAANDYVTYQFTTSASVAETDYFSSISYGAHVTQGYPYRITVLLSESSSFASATEIVSGHQVTAESAYTHKFAPTSERVFVKPSSTYYMRLIIHDVQGADPEGAGTAAILDDPQVGFASCSTTPLSPEPASPAPFYGCSDAERRAGERWWYLGNKRAWDFGVSGKNRPINVSSSALPIDAPEGSLTVSDANGNLQFYSNGISIWDKNHNEMTDALNGHSSANQTAVAAAFDAQPDRYVVVANGTATSMQAKGLTWQVVDMSLNGGNGGVVGVPRVIPGTNVIGETSEGLYAVPNHDGSKAWVLTTSHNDSNLKAFEFDHNGYTGTVVTSPLGNIHPLDVTGTSHINMTDDGTKIVTFGRRNGSTRNNSTHVALIVLDFNAETGEAEQQVSWWTPLGGGYGYYSAVFSKSGKYVYSTGFGPTAERPENLYRYDITPGTSSGIAATRRVFNVGGAGLRRDMDGRIWNTRDGYLDDGDAVNPNFVAMDLQGIFNLTAHVTTCPGNSAAPPVTSSNATRNACAHRASDTVKNLAEIPAGFLQVFDNVTSGSATLDSETITLTPISGMPVSTSTQTFGLGSLGHTSATAPMWYMAGQGVVEINFPSGFDSNQLIGFNDVDDDQGLTKGWVMITAFDADGNRLEMSDWTYERGDNGIGTSVVKAADRLDLLGNNINDDDPILLVRPAPGQKIARLRVLWSEDAGGYASMFLGKIGCADFGDAPDRYATLDSSGGPKHRMLLGDSIYLGSIAPDADYGGSDSTTLEGGFGANATDDNGDASDDDTEGTGDEDGVSGFPTLSVDTTGSYPVSLVCNGDGANVYGWLDFNNNGSFADAGEFAETSCSDSGSGNGGATLMFNGYTMATTGGTSYARFRITSDTLDASGSAGDASDGEVEDYSVTIESGACDALSGDINNGLSPSLQVGNGDKLFLATSTTSSGDRQGHLQAFTVNGSGATASTASWDAGEQMSVTERQDRLYSTAVNGSVRLLRSLDDAAFATNGQPDVATIKAFTFNPNHDSGTYLNGRASDALLGPISPQASPGLIDNTLNVKAYLDDTAYRSFYTGIVSARSDESAATKPSRVLVTSDDGFLYAFDQYDGDLGWGWMPRSLVGDLKNHVSFQNIHPMQGVVDVLDLKDSNGNYATYIVGSYKQGLGQYVLKLNEDSGLGSVISDTDYQVSSSGLMDSAPQNGKRAYFPDGNGRVYTAYVVTDTDAEDSRLFIRSLSDDSVNMQIPLNFVATSVPFVSPDFSNSLAPPAKHLYLGSSTGDIHSVRLLRRKGSLRTAYGIQNGINDGADASLGSTASSAVTFIGATSSSDNAQFYLRAQTEDQLSVFSWQSSDSSWQREWTTWAGGAVSRDEGESSFSDASGSIQALPAGATITAEATMVANSIVLPVTREPTANACYGSAHYYFYKLTDGHFPSQRFYLPGGSTAVSNIVALGYGEARKLQLMNLAGADQLQAVGLADQTTLNTTGISVRMLIREPDSYGLKSWRVLR